MEIKSITLICKRWFQKSYGNTYFSAVALINGEEKARINFEYGYERHCLDRIEQELIKGGLIPDQPRNLIYWCEDNKIEYKEFISDVNRKKDLTI